MDLQRIEALLALLESHDVSEFEFEDAGVRLRLTLGRSAVPTPVAAIPVPAPAATPSGPASAPAADDARLTVVESPMVGTFYRSPTPGAPSFVDVGSPVRPGQALCIIEAMKLMNEIECEVAGTVVEVLVDNGQPVQFGQALFKIRRA
jgi:acetyl-CoA carboxylase biotin carboxyl carrier protein